jgi:hypothetical protein
MMNKIALMGLLLGMLISCGNPIYKEINEPKKNEVVVTIQRTACFGQCPIYDASFDLGNAELRYNGKKFVSLEGEHTYSLSAEEVKSIQDGLVECNFLSLSDSYDGPISDVPSCITSVKMHQELVKEVLNRMDGPEELEKFEDLLDAILKDKLIAKM